jgi:raffinose/stachyose/melibiose transport system permease protein
LKDKAYPHSFYIPAAVVYTVLFLVPTAMAFFFSLTRWT